MNSAVPVKQKRKFSPLVAVIASSEALRRAKRLRVFPDFFELRLDAFHRSLGKVEASISQLRAPLILTARRPEEGGHGPLSLRERTTLLRRFLDFAALVDLELLSVRQMAHLVAELRRRKLGLVLSSHDFSGTPSVARLHRLTRRAIPWRPAIFKLVTRTDAVADLDRLISFFAQRHRYPFPVAVMGIGKLGSLSRREFDRAGSALTYVFLDRARIEGQASLSQLRRVRRAYNH